MGTFKHKETGTIVNAAPGGRLDKRLADDEAYETVHETPADAPTPDPDAPKPPSKSASQEVWAEWAISRGADEATAKAATRQELIDAWGE